MRPRFPLYAKILLWFFLNLVVLACVLFLAFRVQFRLGWDWLLTGNAARRIEAVAHLILMELDERPRSEWSPILERFSSAYRVQFYAFAPNGEQWAGESIDLPPEVKTRLQQRRPPRRPGVVPPQTPREAPRPGHPRSVHLTPAAPAAPAPPPPVHAAPHEPYPKTIVRTADPIRYWIVVRAGLLDHDRPRTQPISLIAMSSSLSGGGLLFDSKPWLAAGLGVLLISALLWFPFVRGITRSIAQMTQATGQIAQGQFDVRVDAGRQDELGLLGGAINGMAVRLAELVSGQKQFLGNIAHELCSPLARLQVALGILDQRAGDRQRPYVSAACEKAEQIAALVNELLSFSKASLGPSCIKLEPVRVAEVVRKAVCREASEQVVIQSEAAEDLLAMAQPELLVRALSNLLRNALRYAGDAGPVEISARLENGDILLAVADHGPGVPEEHLPKLFDPFFRVDPSRDRSTGGVGLGLTIVKTCVAACNGSVLCRNRQPHGLEVLIRLSAAAVSD